MAYSLRQTLSLEYTSKEKIKYCVFQWLNNEESGQGLEVHVCNAMEVFAYFGA